MTILFPYMAAIKRIMIKLEVTATISVKLNNKIILMYMCYR